MDNKWHYTDNGEYPEVFGQYENDNYPQIPCLVEDLGFFGIRYWNVTAQCWDIEAAKLKYCFNTKHTIVNNWPNEQEIEIDENEYCKKLNIEEYLLIKMLEVKQ